MSHSEENSSKYPPYANNHLDRLNFDRFCEAHPNFPRDDDAALRELENALRAIAHDLGQPPGHFSSRYYDEALRRHPRWAEAKTAPTIEPAPAAFEADEPTPGIRASETAPRAAEPAQTKTEAEAETVPPDEKSAPRPPFPILQQVPTELAPLKRWIGWRYAWSDEQKKWVKLPTSPLSGQSIGVTPAGKNGEDWASHWLDFRAARAGAVKLHLDGVGFVFVKNDGYLGIDLDACRNPQTGELRPFAARWLASLDTYAEASPSSTGFHSLARGSLPGSGNKRPLPEDPDVKVEMYDDKRFFTFTGERLDGKPPALNPIQNQIDALHAHVFSDQQKKDIAASSVKSSTRRVLENAAIIKRIVATPKWAAIFNKDVAGAAEAFVNKHYAGDDSAADMAFCTLAARLTNDPAQIVELWQASVLWRTKAAERTDYRTGTVTKALAAQQPRGTDIRKRRDVVWAWKGYLPLGKLVLIDGDPGLAKSMFTLRLANSFMFGQPLPDGSLPTVTGGVLLLSAEDDPYDTINPRLAAAGAPDDIIPLEIRGVLKDDKTVFSLASPSDLIELELLIVRLGAKLVIIDPLNAFLGEKVDSHNDQKIRQVLGPLSEIANRTGATILAIRHARKSGGAKAIHVGLGSIGYTAAARANFFVAEHPEEKNVFVLAPSKFNLGPKPPSLRYHIETLKVAGITDPVPYVTGFGPCDLTANDLAAAQSDEAESGGKLGEAIEFVRKVLAQGVTPSGKLEAAAHAEGISPRTLRRAKKSLNVKSGQRGRTWSCWLPEERGTTTNTVASKDEEVPF